MFNGEPDKLLNKMLQFSELLISLGKSKKKVQTKDPKINNVCFLCIMAVI